jgi:4-diphosphocytidyl-2-C-methyl-D-erythritol kinase
VGEARSLTASETLRAPAKLTRTLRVTGVRGDGYHLLDTEMLSVDLEDLLEVTESDRTLISVVDEVVGGLGVGAVPIGETNLVAKALSLAGITAQVRLVKRIPPGAGLGGGSSDAAAILRWAGITDPDVAVRVGADVPFCVHGGRARVRGIGEVVERLPDVAERLVILFPPLAVSTEAVYRKWDALGPARTVRADLAAGVNDLEVAALEVEPQLAKWRDCLEKITGRKASLAGSGSAWFVEGEPRQLNLAGRDELIVDGERGALVSVRTVPAEP